MLTIEFKNVENSVSAAKNSGFLICCFFVCFQVKTLNWSASRPEQILRPSWDGSWESRYQTDPISYVLRFQLKILFYNFITRYQTPNWPNKLPFLTEIYYYRFIKSTRLYMKLILDCSYSPLAIKCMLSPVTISDCNIWKFGIWKLGIITCNIQHLTRRYH